MKNGVGGTKRKVAINKGLGSGDSSDEENVEKIEDAEARQSLSQAKVF